MSYNSSFDRGSWRRPVYGAGVQAIDVDLGLRRYCRSTTSWRPGLA